MNHERGLHFLGYSGPVSGFCVAGGMFTPYGPFARLAGSTWAIFSDMGQHGAEHKACEIQHGTGQNIRHGCAGIGCTSKAQQQDTGPKPETFSSFHRGALRPAQVRR